MYECAGGIYGVGSLSSLESVCLKCAEGRWYGIQPNTMKTAAFNALLVEFNRRMAELGVAPWHLPSHLEKSILRGELMLIVHDRAGEWRRLQLGPATEKGLNELFGV